MTNTKALQLESRFSMPPNALKYCGRNTAGEQFRKCIIDGECSKVEEEVTKFIVLFPYLKTIAEITGKPVYSYETIESYWIGNDELKKSKPEDYTILLKHFKKQGVPEWLLKELENDRPKNFIPSHLFQILHVGVGRASGAVPFNLESINHCMIRWGEVTKIVGDKLTAKLHMLKKNNDKYELTMKNETVAFDRTLIPELKKGDTVAVHWKMAIKILTEDEVTKINYWTQQVLDSLS